MLVEADLAELDAGLVGLEAGHGSHELDHAGPGRSAALQEPQRSLDVGRAERVPLALGGG